MTGRDITDSAAASARIIPFPARGSAADWQDPRARLRRAVAMLDAALVEQSGAVAAWREAMVDLQVVMDGVGERLETYRRRLGSITAGLDGLHRETVQLETWVGHAAAGQG